MNRYNSLVCLVAALVLLPACTPLDWIKSKLGLDKKEQVGAAPATGEGTVLASWDNGEKITVADLRSKLDQVMEENPQLKQILPFMPDVEKNLLQSMVQQKNIDAYIKKEGIDKTPDYLAKKARLEESVVQLLNAQFFNTSMPVTVADADIEEFYNTKRSTIPDLISARGGVKAEGISFATEAKAKAFVASAQGKDFTKVAKEAGLGSKIRDFKLVNETTPGVDANVKRELLALAKFPATVVVKASEKEFWVAHATERQEDTYYPLDQVRVALGQYMEREAQSRKAQETLNALQKEFHVTINEDYFKEKQNPQVAVADTELDTDLLNNFDLGDITDTTKAA